MADRFLMTQTNRMCLVTAPAGGENLFRDDDCDFPVHCCTMSLMRGTVKVAPVDPATNTTLSNCRSGRILEYGPSIRTDLPMAGAVDCGRLEIVSRHI